MKNIYEQQLNTFVGRSASRKEKEQHLNAVIYTRVSSNKQVENTSLEMQKTRCEEYAHHRNFPVKAYFGGTSESAKTDDRKELNKLLSYVKNSSNKIGFILVFDYSRFSRTGIEAKVLINDLLKKHNVRLISVSQNIDTSKTGGDTMESLMLILSNADNITRKEKILDGVIKRLHQGHSFGRAPRGYKRLHQNGDIRYELTEDAGKIRQAFLWRSERISIPEIRSRLKELGLSLQEKHLFKMLKNVFYCGYVSNALIDGIVKGQQPPIIDEETFFKANEIKFLKTTKGYESTDISLKGCIKCDKCGRPLTAYHNKLKKKFYYKCQTVGCKLNRSNKKLNNLFYDMLSELKIEPQLYPIIKNEIVSQAETNEDKNAFLLRELNNELKLLNEKKEILEGRYAFGEIDREMYNKFRLDIDGKIVSIEKRVKELRFELSNFLDQVDNSIKFLSELHILWDRTNLSGRLDLQNCLFPDGIIYDREKNTYRTSKLNEFVLSTLCFSEHLQGHKKSEKPFLSDFSPSVARRGCTFTHAVAAYRIFTSSKSPKNTRVLQIEKCSILR